MFNSLFDLLRNKAQQATSPAVTEPPLTVEPPVVVEPPKEAIPPVDVVPAPVEADPVVDETPAAPVPEEATLPAAELPIEETPVEDAPVEPEVEEADSAPEDVTVPDPAPLPDDDATGGQDNTPVVESPFPAPTGETIKPDVEKIDGGRVTTINIDASKPIAGVQITGQPAFGHASVNPDNSIALVLSGTNNTGKLTLDYTIAYTDGTAESFSSEFEVSAPLHEAGWGQGEHYMLEVDANDNLVIETGDVHRDVYIGGSDTALSRADIARIEGLDASAITRSWLIKNPEYGGSEAMALDSDAGMDLWYGLTGNEQKSSHWLQLERGHTYKDLGQIIFRGASGENELHPLHVTSWGEGARPVIDSEVKIYQRDSDNLVFTEVTLSDGLTAFEGRGLILDDVSVEDKGMVLQGYNQATVRNSNIEHISRDVATSPDGVWRAHIDRDGGMFAAGNSGLLIEGNFVHHNGWQDGYDGTPGKGQPPSQFSQNIYLQNTTQDVTFRDNILSQGASFGAQLRGGGFVEDNAFIDNNVAFNIGGGIYNGTGPIGNFSFVTGNVVTSGAHKVANLIGALAMGAENYAHQSTFLDNIVAHLADPNNEAEFLEKLWANAGLNHQKEAHFDNTIVHNWAGSRYGNDRTVQDLNTDGLDQNVLNQTTIQNFAADLLGRSDATISDLANYISSLADTPQDDSFTADEIIAYFQNGFSQNGAGITKAAVDTQGSHRFVPSDLADGFRWDSRINWDSKALPGEGDDVDLGGNRVLFGGKTISVDNLDLGDNGILRVTSGVLRVEDTLETGRSGGQLEIDGAGQFWTAGFSGMTPLTVDAAGGRFVNTGDIEGRINLNVTDTAQVILGTDADSFDFFDGGALSIEGSNAKVGFDGAKGGTAVLRLNDSATLSFTADKEGIAGIGEFRSGAFGDTPDVRSGINLGGSSLKLDLDDMPKPGSYTLMRADELIGRFEEIDVIGLHKRQDLSVTIDYEADTVSVLLGRKGQGEGRTDLSFIGNQSDAQQDRDLWDALTDDHATWNDAMNTAIYDDGRLIEAIG